MKRDYVDPSLLEGEELERWYLRTPEDIEAERQAARAREYEGFYGGLNERRWPEEGFVADADTWDEDAGFQRVRYQVPRPPAVRPGGARIGVPPGGAAIAPGGSRGGFFNSYGTVPNSALGPAYITDLPSPLNVVIPQYGGWFRLGDGTLVKHEEVERLHAEQQRRIAGQEDPEPAATVHSADRYRDGVIPRADQLEKGQREKDLTCHPNGGWELDPQFPSYSERTRRYEEQITRAPGLDYVVRNPGEKAVKFDGCAVWDKDHQLLEAKGPGYGSLAKAARKYRGLRRVITAPQSQAARQTAAARGQRVDWHVAEAEASSFFEEILPHHPLLRLQHTPAN